MAMRSQLLKCNHGDVWVLLFDESNIWAITTMAHTGQPNFLQQNPTVFIIYIAS